MKHFRVDRMDDIGIAEYESEDSGTKKSLKRDSEDKEYIDCIARDGEDEFEALKLSERSTKVFSMYGGKEKNVKLRFSNHLISVVIDRFGKDTMMIPDGDKHFTINVAVEVSPQFFGWLCGFGRAVKVMTPEIADEMRDYVSGIVGIYQDDAEGKE